MQFDDITNYYETLIYDEVSLLSEKMPELEEDELKDIACVALNKLPAQYIRYHVDVIFFLSSEERDKIDNNIKQAVSEALNFVTSHPRSAA